MYHMVSSLLLDVSDFLNKGNCNEKDRYKTCC